jgi:hypothetical protein
MIWTEILWHEIGDTLSVEEGIQEFKCCRYNEKIEQYICVKKFLYYKILCFHTGGYEELYFLGYNAV